MKILHPLLCYYPSQAGGPANTIYWINNSLNSNDFTSEIVTTQFGLINKIKTKEYSKNHRATFFNSNGTHFISKSLKELKTSDIIQFSSLFFPPTLPLLILAIIKNKAVLLSPRGELYEAAIGQKSFKKKVWVSAVRLFQNKINFHATNDQELKIIQKTFSKAKSSVVIPNFIEMPKKINKEIEMKFIFLGRINPIKNIHLLIDAFNIVQKQYPTIKLEVLGSARLDYEKQYFASLREQIKKLSLENVILFKGHLDGETKNNMIASSKALILPSKSENFGNVVLEALAQGTPVIASQNTPWQLLEKFKAGYWIDVNEIAKSMMKLLELKDSEYMQMRKNAFELCKSKFDIKTNIHVWENYYKKTTTYVQK